MLRELFFPRIFFSGGVSFQSFHRHRTSLTAFPLFDGQKEEVLVVAEADAVVDPARTSFEKHREMPKKCVMYPGPSTPGP